jgi:actin-related protein
MFNSAISLNIGGKHLTDYLIKNFAEKNYSFCTSSEREIVIDIKEKLGFVSSDFEKEMKLEGNNSIEKQYELPDGQVITVDRERFMCAEPLFRPHLLEIEELKGKEGIHKILHNSIITCEKDIQNGKIKKLKIFTLNLLNF